ncbi:hypothetical protein ACFQPA_21895 [Halomarina halobia]|uniref:GntR family transcriptional regulator n=1 Tax=Halomarina halobia TaxID=3033386 RepID=A0ABD6AFE2_9EURY|nr:hypothetical protein [Halomarina sp. PSR21]
MHNDGERETDRDALAAKVARVVEYNTGGPQPVSIEPFRVGQILTHRNRHSPAQVDAAIEQALEQGFITTTDSGELVSAEGIR